VSQAHSRKINLCSECASDNQIGANNPNWKGGHKHWSPGRYGKDKDGLSWKIQRNLAWERDNETCQHCHEKKGRKPDVHHINPWMNSLSHALDNLVCLCQSCHLKEEAKVHEIWGGQLVVNRQETLGPCCSECGHYLQGGSKEIGLCRKCKPKTMILEAKNLRSAGLGYEAIAIKMGIATMSAFYYVNGRK
jgi:hypothetical protein